MLLGEGVEWKVPYDEIRRLLKIRNKQVAPELQRQADQRFRTYLTLFRGLGLVYVEDNKLHATNAGKQLLQLLEEQYRTVDDFAQRLSNGSRDQLARLMAPVLVRYELANPFSTEYPPGTDIRPLRAMWKAARALDNKLHWEELGRALTPCLRESELDRAIESIRTARATPGYDPTNAEMMTVVLGPRIPDAGSDHSDRLDVWFSRAAFKNIFLEARDSRTDGYRHINMTYAGLIDEMIALERGTSPSDPQAYMEWVGEGAVELEPRPAANDSLVDTVVARCRKYGAKQIIALIGPAGTGKTMTAHAAAEILTQGDQTRVMTVQFHSGFSYEEFVGGLSPQDGTFVPAPGVLTQINDQALKSPQECFVLVVDELSRADVSNVLGELLTYIEYRGRPFKVPSLNRDIAIAPNLVIIATLNPADRSVLNMDDALIRRLRQIEVPRSAEALSRIMGSAGAAPALIESVAGWFGSLPDDVPFGHGLFQGIRDESDLHDLWHESLKYFLRRGGLTVYPGAELVEEGFIWRRGSAYASSHPDLIFAPNVVEEEAAYADGN
jgi:5-methylcytosine-specific restriction protein B